MRARASGLRARARAGGVKETRASARAGGVKETRARAGGVKETRASSLSRDGMDRFDVSGW